MKKKKKLDHVLFMLYILFSFILIGEVFNFRHKARKKERKENITHNSIIYQNMDRLKNEKYQSNKSK